MGARGVEVRAVLLVEGESDRAAVLAVARRQGRPLTDEGVAVLAMGGVTNAWRFLQAYGPAGRDLQVAGLFDEAQAGAVRRALQLPADAHLESRGFFACIADLEDELVRALGVAAVEGVVAAQGELRSLRRLQRQPAQRGRPVEDQLRRFFGSRSGRKLRYAALLVEALEPDAVPRPLVRVLAAVGGASAASAAPSGSRRPTG